MPSLEPTFNVFLDGFLGRAVFLAGMPDNNSSAAATSPFSAVRAR
jgi:hypothetical protein